MSRVHLAVYDLSRGMAAAMSQSILGQRIDGIWHTGIVVFHTEYYFGGGIQATPTGAFAAQNGLQPVQMQDMGLTTKTQAELESFLRTINHQYTQATYDLINNNCNNFANVVCNFLTGHGIPEHIVDLPRIVFSTPGGAMLRPMIEGMQNNIRQQSGAGMDPFGAGGRGAPISAATGPQIQPFESALSDSIAQVAHRAVPRSPRSTAAARKRKLAELEENPLISGDASTVAIISKKILNLAAPVSVNDSVPAGEKGSALSADQKEVVNRIVNQLTVGATGSAAQPFPAEAYALLEHVLDNHSTAHMSCLFLLRLMLLQEQKPLLEQSTPAYHSIVSNVIHRLVSYSPNADSSADGDMAALSFSSVPAYAMAICALSNFISHPAGADYLLRGYHTLGSASTSSGVAVSGSDYLVDVILAGLSHERAEIKQMSVTLAYNYSLACTPAVNNTTSSVTDTQPKASLAGGWETDGGVAELHPHALQLLCCCLEGILTETDATVRRRRLAVVCRIYRAYGTVASGFVQELGFVDGLEVLLHSEQYDVKPKLTVEEEAIVSELVSYYQT